jgi:hypothetical protein
LFIRRTVQISLKFSGLSETLNQIPDALQVEIILCPILVIGTGVIVEPVVLTTGPGMLLITACQNKKHGHEGRQQCYVFSISCKSSLLLDLQLIHVGSNFHATAWAIWTWNLNWNLEFGT